MADYWKSIDKKWCESCRCWITDNRSSVEFHESGRRHQANVQNRLRNIQKKAREDGKQNKRIDYELKKIEKAAQATYHKDKAENPDYSLQLQNYLEEQNPEILGDPNKALKKTKKEEEAAAALGQPKILHRSESSSKKVKNINAPPPMDSRPYTSRGGWSAMDSLGRVVMDLELPTVAKKPKPMAMKLDEPTVTASSSSGNAFKMTFTEKKVSSELSAQPSSSSSSSSFSFTKSGTGNETVAFKKRKLPTKNTRQRLEED